MTDGILFAMIGVTKAKALERGIPGRTVRDAKRELGDALKSKIVEGRKKVFWME